MKHLQQFELLIGGRSIHLTELPAVRATCTTAESNNALELNYTSAPSPNRTEHRRVYLTPSGQRLVDSRLVSIALPPDYNAKHQDALLKRHACTTPEHAKNAHNAEPCTFACRHLPLRVPDDQCCLAFTEALSRDADTLTAEPLLLQHLAPRAFADPLAPWQWSHDRTGLRFAHQHATGRGVRILLIDHGFDTTHPDLAANLASDFAAYRETSNGHLLTFNRPADLPTNAHGTFVAGVLAADQNAFGIRGAAPDATLQLAAVTETGTQRQLATAIRDALAAPEPPDIISCSLGPHQGGWPLQHVLRDAIEHAARHGRGGRGIPIFWAAANAFEPIALDHLCAHPDVIAIGRSDLFDHPNGSAHGPGLDLLAPGVHVLGTASPATHATNTGTSFAAPLVAGVAALLLQRRPDATASQIRAWLHQSARPGWSPALYGAGILNAAHAIALAG